jgi:hypothetical protein
VTGTDPPLTVEQALARDHAPTCALRRLPVVREVYVDGQFVGWRFEQLPSDRCTCNKGARLPTQK